MSWERTGARLRPIGPSSSQPQKPYTEMGSQPTGNTFAIVNQKGGVGKTTTAVNLSAALASLGRIILLVDLDPQGNSTSGVGISKTGLRMSVYDVLIGGDPIDHVIQRTATAGLDLVPSDVRLAGAEVELTATIARENRLKAALRTVRNHYDVVLIDCPPSLGLLTVLARDDDRPRQAPPEYRPRSVGSPPDDGGSPNKTFRPGGDRGQEPLWEQGLRDGRPKERPAGRGPKLWPADHRVRARIAGRGSLPDPGRRVRRPYRPPPWLQSGSRRAGTGVGRRGRPQR